MIHLKSRNLNKLILFETNIGDFLFLNVILVHISDHELD